MQIFLKIQKACMLFSQDQIAEKPTPLLILNANQMSMAYASTQDWKWLYEFAETEFYIHGETSKYFQLGVHQHFPAHILGSRNITLLSRDTQQNGSET